MAVWDIYVKFQVVVYRVYTYTSESLLMMFFYSVLAGDSSYKLYVSKSLLLKKVVFLNQHIDSVKRTSSSDKWWEREMILSFWEARPIFRGVLVSF